MYFSAGQERDDTLKVLKEKSANQNMHLATIPSDTKERLNSVFDNLIIIFVYKHLKV